MSLPLHHPDQSAVPPLSLEEMERRRAFSRRLRAFLRSEYYLNEVEEQPEDDDPARYILAQLLAVEVTAGLYIDVYGSVEQIATTLITASESEAVGNSANTQGTSVVLFKMAASLAPQAREWAAQKRKSYDKASVLKQCREAAAHQDLLDGKTAEICARICHSIEVSGELDYEVYETAIVTLQILLQATSKSVTQTLRDVPRADVGKIAAWSTGVAVGVAGFSACLFLPVIPAAAAFGTVFWGMTAGAAGSATLTGVGVDMVYKTGKSLARTHKIANEIKTEFRSIHTNIKAFVAFLGYLWQTQPLLEYRNNSAYLALLVELDESLSSERARWSDPNYIATYIEKASRKLDVNTDNLRSHMSRLGVSIDPLSI